MPDITVEMLRRTNDVAGTLVSWLINPDGTEPVADAVARDKLEAIRVLLAGTRDVRVVNQSGSTVSTANGTMTTLLAGAEYTGNWESVRDYAGISVLVNTDVYSAVNGAILEFSIDGVTVDKSITSTVPPGGAAFSFPPQAEFMRLRYINGAANQTVMRAEVILELMAPALVQQPIGAPLTDANMAAVMRSMTSGRKSTGAWTPLAATDAGSLRVALDTIENLATNATLSTLGTEATLELVRAQLAAINVNTDMAEALLTDLRTRLDRQTFTASGRQLVEAIEPPARASYASMSIPASAWTTIIDATPAVDFTILGFNADVSALTNISYRQRLVRLDAMAAVAETYMVSTTNANSVAWIPISLALAANTRVAVQVFHAELSAQNFDCTLNWRDRG